MANFCKILAMAMLHESINYWLILLIEELVSNLIHILGNLSFSKALNMFFSFNLDHGFIIMYYNQKVLLF
jgi:hypothetical protein